MDKSGVAELLIVGSGCGGVNNIYSWWYDYTDAHGMA